jgi:hypothetical protein
MNNNIDRLIDLNNNPYEISSLFKIFVIEKEAITLGEFENLLTKSIRLATSNLEAYLKRAILTHIEELEEELEQEPLNNVESLTSDSEENMFSMDTFREMFPLINK